MRQSVLDKFVHLIEFALLLLVLLIQAKLYTNQHNTESDLKLTVIRLEKELAESEARCKRMTDTCIDILANNRWE